MLAAEPFRSSIAAESSYDHRLPLVQDVTFVPR